MARTSAVAALRDRLAEVTAERDRLAAAIQAIPRHTRCTVACGVDHCATRGCKKAWPCPTEQAHIAAAATHQGNPSSVGSGCDGDHGAGTPDPATAGRPTGRPAPKDDHRCGPHCWGRCTHDPGVDL